MNLPATGSRLCAALLLGVHLLAPAAPARVDVEVSGFDCRGAKDSYSYVATWPDVADAGTYYIKLGNQCVLDRQQCTTNAPKSCRATCVKGRCRAEFGACRTGRAGYVIVFAANGQATGEKRFAAPACR